VAKKCLVLCETHVVHLTPKTKRAVINQWTQGSIVLMIPEKELEKLKLGG
jgi:hypothetical protein